MREPFWLCGSLLHPEDKRHVLAAYVHRFTGEHRPAWASKPWKDGRPYPIQHADDADWLANTYFRVRKDARLDMRVRECHSTPSWPNNPELRKAVSA